METIFDKNVTSYTDLPTTSVTNLINSGSQEAISEVMDKVEVVLMRTDHSSKDDKDHTINTGTVKSRSYDEFIGDGTDKLITTSSPAYENNKIYSVESGIMSGLYGHIGLLVILDCVYGIDVDGYTDINNVISDFQEKYNQSEVSGDKSDLIYRFGKDKLDGECIFLYEEN